MTLRFLLFITCLTSLNIVGTGEQSGCLGNNFFKDPDGSFLLDSSEELVDLESIPLDNLDSQPLIAPNDLSYQDVMTLTNDESAEPANEQTPGRAYPCTLCGKSFTKSSLLKVHMLTHTGERPYQCSMCDKSFLRSSELTRHSYAHIGGRYYPCSICGKPFTQKSDCTRHTKTHLEVQSYPCVTCNKLFATQSSLTRHLKTHGRISTGEKPYSCDTCGRSFARDSDRARHKASLHPE